MKNNTEIPPELHVLANVYTNTHDITMDGDKLTIDINHAPPHPTIPLEAIPVELRKQYAELDTMIAEHFATLFSGKVKKEKTKK
jgi:hypothetical protein